MFMMQFEVKRATYKMVTFNCVKKKIVTVKS